MKKFITLSAALALPVLLSACTASVTNEAATDDETSPAMMDSISSEDADMMLNESGSMMNDDSSMMENSTSSDSGIYDNPEDNARD